MGSRGAAVRSRLVRLLPPPLLLFALAVVLRILPNVMNAAWGNDFGIYLGLTERILETGDIFPAYDGWGTSYQYFPALYLAAAAVHLVTGASPVIALGLVAGFAGGLTVHFAYRLGLELFASRRLALLGALLLAVEPVHVYETSHPAPLALGHLSLVLTLWLFLRWRRGGSWWPLIPAVGLLLTSHHLSTYVLLLDVAGIAFAYRLLNRSDDGTFRRDLRFLGFVTTAAFAYWGVVATPVLSHVQWVTGLPAGVVLPLGLAAILLAGRFVPKIAARASPVLTRLLGELNPRRAFLVILSFGVGFLVLNIVAPPWGPVFGLRPEALFILLPVLLLLALAGAGFALAVPRIRWTPLVGILLATLGSLAFGMVTQSTVILPLRHLEYLSLPVCFFAAKALRAAAQRWSLRAPGLLRARWAGRLPGVMGIAATVLLLSNAWSGYAVTVGALGIDGRIPDASLGLVDWMASHLETNGSVAADHRMSQILWARGFNATNDDAVLVFTEAEWDRIEGELRTFDPRVDYVLVDHVMVESGVQSGVVADPPRMTEASYAKFSLAPFQLVHREESADGTRWAELYRIDWEWADRHTK